ncbi:asparagine synthase (glutamine-hydrolyzing) [Haloarcula salinisoli]|uniref:Putative asparagine synthetase [glutamine-hydrolyzing] n=1 Tax=Haloarcula salinisoli TaxID=2487746 RepID=A0A8J8CET6_9EURY|nr:asparagine synthase (glutamine-hydrolyzing) [Halomicroarcula salinisoli]MBX0306040.1 asparagine synthase (glutamine-hydrolyzing) [Halomicroarcula salinisoli]
MCGIAGGYNVSDKQLLDDMTGRLEHRGPDDTGYYVSDNVMLGIRRLSVIDVAGGHQPIFNEDRSVCVVFNGEIYNYRELRERLERRGHTFRSESDTEVLVHLYEEHGRDLVTHLNGMFAFAIWDQRSDRLLLARDRLGIKPLYFMERADGLYFASEIDSLLEVTAEPSLSSTGVGYFWHLDYIPAPYTPFERISKLEPGSLLVCEGDSVTSTSYWELGAPRVTDRSERDCVRRVRGLLEDAVKKRMVADMPVGAFLSGGLDSSTIVGLMSRHSDRPVQTYSIGFEAAEFDERGHARTVADYFGTDHTEYQVDLSDASLVEEKFATMGDPVADPAIIPTSLIAERASQDSKVVTIGSGADELFGGYDSYRRELYAAGSERPTEAMLKYREPDQEHLNMETRAVDALVEGTTKESWSNFHNITQFDIEYWLPDRLLQKDDRATMSHSLEARVPFLDHRLVEESRRIPPEYLIKDGNKKHILKQAFRQLLPDEILERKKSTFSVPIGNWMAAPDSPLAGRFTEERFAPIEFVDESWIVNRYREFCNGDDSHKLTLWRALVFQIWYEEYLMS